MRTILQKEEDTTRKCVDAIKAIFVGVDTKYRVTLINKEGCRLLGYKEKEIIGKDWFENFVPSRIRSRAKTTFNNLIAGKSELVECQESPVLTKRGKERIITWHNALLRDEHGKIRAVLSSGEDCNARKQTEQQLKSLAETNAGFVNEWQQTFDTVPCITALISPDFKILKINRAGYEGLGKKPEELIGKTCYEVVHGLDHPIQGCPCLETLSTKKSGSGEIVDHGRAYIATADPVLDENNELIAFVHTIKDITKRKKTEEEKERLLLDLVERVKELNCLYDLSKLVAQLDISVEEILQETLSLIPPGWQYPDITCSRIVLKEKEFKTNNFKATKWKQSADIKVFGKRTGSVEVCYLEEKPANHEGPFLKEERDLVNAIAERLGQTIESKKAEGELKSSRERLKILFELAPDGYYLSDLKGSFVDGNKAAEDIIGCKKEELIGNSFLKLKLLTTEQLPKAAKGLAMNALGRPTGPDEFTLLRKDGSKVPVEIKTFPVKVRGQSLVLGIARDITDRKEQEKQLSYLATHDHLSGLPNRRSLENVLKRAVARARRGAKSALLFIDLDNFKLINDNFGHMAGDQVLIALAQLLQKSLRVESFLARLGGDEFAIWLEQADIVEAQAVAERIRQTVEEHTFNMSKHQFKLSISIGVTIIEGKQDLWESMSHADTAMYKAKEKGRNQVYAL